MESRSNPESFIIGGFFAGSFALCLMASSPYHWLSGFASWGIGESLRYRRKQSYAEIWKGSADYLKDIVSDVSEVASPISSAVDGAKLRIMTSALQQLPLGDRLADRYLAGQGVSTDWFQGFERRSAVVCGESKDGKTHLLLWRVQRFLEANPEGTILICDPDYGSSHDEARPNDWFKLPLGSVVQTESDEITAAIIGTSEEVATRARATKQAIANGKAKPKFKPLLLVVDEWVSYWGSLDDKTRETVLTAVSLIMNRGIKQGSVTFLLGLHDLSVGSTGLTQAILSQLETVLLYRASQRTRNYGNLDIDKQAVNEAIARVKLLPSSRRPCVVWSDKQLSVRAVPDLAIADIELVSPEQTDPDESWINSVFTAEFELQVIKQGLNLTQAWLATGMTSKEQRNSNPRYQLFKSRFAQMQGSDPGDSGRLKVDEREAIATVDNQSESQDPTFQAQPTDT